MMRIDVDSVLRQRLPRHYKYIPRLLIRWIERTICQEEMNELLETTGELRDADFCRAVIDYLGIKISVEGRENLPASGRQVIVCNHPLGGLDGIAMIAFFSSIYGDNLHFVVNDLLMAVEPLQGVFLPVNKFGRQSREATEAIDNAFNSDAPIIVFPAGLVSRRRDGKVGDLRWHKMFVNRCISSGRDVIPVHFSGENSSFFYTFANLRERLGIRLNIEMVYLPREVFKARGGSFRITIGKPISYNDLAGGRQAQETADRLREKVYSLPSKNESV